MCCSNPYRNIIEHLWYVGAKAFFYFSSTLSISLHDSFHAVGFSMSYKLLFFSVGLQVVFEMVSLSLKFFWKPQETSQVRAVFNVWTFFLCFKTQTWKQIWHLSELSKTTNANTDLVSDIWLQIHSIKFVVPFYFLQYLSCRLLNQFALTTVTPLYRTVA